MSLFSQKPYKCEVTGCHKRYTDPSSLRKHVMNHSKEDQDQVRLLKEASKGARRGSLPDLLLHQHHHHTDYSHHHQGGSWEQGDLMASTGNLHLMSGGGLVAPLTSLSSDPEADLWTRRLEAEDPRYHHHQYYYNANLHVEV